MRIEQVPLILGALVALAALGFLVDAWLPEHRSWRRERRRRQRAERDRTGEALIALGLGAIAAALIGRDIWRYDTVAVLVGTLLLALGAALNWRYLRELFLFRGPRRSRSARRRRSRRRRLRWSASAPSRPPASPTPASARPTPMRAAPSRGCGSGRHPGARTFHERAVSCPLSATPCTKHSPHPDAHIAVRRAVFVRAS